MANEPRRYYLVQNPDAARIDAYGLKDLGNGSFLFNLLASADQSDFANDQEITFALNEQTEKLEPDALIAALLRRSRIVVPITAGQDLNGGGAFLTFDAIAESLPLTNPDFTVVPAANQIIFNRAGFVRIAINMIGAAQTSARKQPVAAALVNGAPAFDGVMTDYSRDLTNDFVQLECSDIVKAVAAGDIVQVFSLGTGTAGGSLTVANQCYIRLEYLNNVQL